VNCDRILWVLGKIVWWPLAFMGVVVLGVSWCVAPMALWAWKKGGFKHQ
jgi:hypothetical protein